MMNEDPLIDAPIRIQQVKLCIENEINNIKKIEEETNQEFMTKILEQELIISQARDKVKELKKELKEKIKTKCRDCFDMKKMYEESLVNAEIIYHNAKLKASGRFNED